MLHGLLLFETPNITFLSKGITQMSTRTRGLSSASHHIRTRSGVQLHFTGVFKQTTKIKVSCVPIEICDCSIFCGLIFLSTNYRLLDTVPSLVKSAVIKVGEVGLTIIRFTVT